MKDEFSRADEASGDTIVAECELPDSPEKVWRAVTQPEFVTEWLMPGDIGAETGRRFSLFPDEGEALRIDCEVLECQPQRLLRYSWRDGEARRDGLTSTVTFELLPREGGGTHLRIVHGGFRRIGMPAATVPTAANTNQLMMMRRVA